MTGADARDALLLAFTELDGYGVLTVAAAPGTAAGVAATLTETLRAVAPHGTGSYAFWRSAGVRHVAGRPP